MLSSHHYKSFKISMIHKLRFTTDVQLGNPWPSTPRPKLQIYCIFFLGYNSPCSVSLIVGGWHKNKIFYPLSHMKENPDHNCCKKMKWGWMNFLGRTDQTYDSLFFRHFRRKVRDWSRHQSEGQHQVLDPTETHLHRLGPPLCLWPGGGEKPQWVKLWWGGRWSLFLSCPVRDGCPLSPRSRHI